MTGLLTVSEVAQRTTLDGERYVAPWQVTRCLQRLIAEGVVADERVGRQRVILAADLRAVQAALGIGLHDADDRARPATPTDRPLGGPKAEPGPR